MRVTGRFFAPALIIMVAALCTGCWTEDDTYSINKDGNIRFNTLITIEDKGSSFGEIDEETNEHINVLTNSGWRLSKAWVSKTWPYKLTVSGTGNLRTIESVLGFYDLKKITDSEYSIRFYCQTGCDRRSISFVNLFSADSAKVYDSSGKPVERPENVNVSEVYMIRLR